MPITTQHRWIAAIGLAFACVGTPHASTIAPVEPEQATTPAAALEPAPVEVQPTPLTELDADAIAALPEPAKPEPAPFDEAMRARIAAVQPIVAAAAAAYGVEPALINAVIYVESKFDRKARGPAGAQGLMQLMPKTASALAKQMGRSRNSYDPDFNIHAGTLLLSQLLKRFDGDLTLALAGYNRGSGTVAKWVAAGEPLPEGTQGFVNRVLKAKAWFEQP